MAVILAFPGCRVPPHAPALPSLPVPFTPAWQREHLPLIDAALDLLATDDAEFARRCRLMADEAQWLSPDVRLSVAIVSALEWRAVEE